MARSKALNLRILGWLAFVSVPFLSVVCGKFGYELLRIWCDMLGFGNAIVSSNADGTNAVTASQLIGYVFGGIGGAVAGLAVPVFVGMALLDRADEIERKAKANG